jgi:hypothetical protein
MLLVKAALAGANIVIWLVVVLKVPPQTFALSAISHMLR